MEQSSARQGKANARPRWLGERASADPRAPRQDHGKESDGHGDAAISVDTSIDGPPASAAGLIFHYQDDKNFYIYSVDGEGRYELDVYKDDKPTTLIEWTV